MLTKSKKDVVLLGLKNIEEGVFHLAVCIQIKTFTSISHLYWYRH